LPRASDPLAVLLYLLARNVVPWGTLDETLRKARSKVAPEIPADDPLVAWATQQADLLRNP
jgi:hypothetical protein